MLIKDLAKKYGIELPDLEALKVKFLIFINDYKEKNDNAYPTTNEITDFFISSILNLDIPVELLPKQGVNNDH